MHFAPLPYLDPGSGLLIIQLIYGCAFCGAPLAVIATVVAFLRRSIKKNNKEVPSIEEN